MVYSSRTMKLSILSLLLMISSFSFAQTTNYFRQLRYNHVSPYIDIVGIHPIDSSTASTTSHYILKYNKSKNLTEIINHHYSTEKVHPLASLGVHKVIISYDDDKEIRTFYDPNNNRITNDRKVFKEVYLLDKNGLRKQLNFYDLDNKAMESNWDVAKYQWEQSKKYVVERRYDLEKNLQTLSPYFKFGVTGIIVVKNGMPKGNYNLNSKLQITEDESGVAPYQDEYDKMGNHIRYTYHNKKGDLTMNQWNYAIGEKTYDKLGNFIELKLLDDKQNLITTREIPSNVSLKTSPPASRKDSLEIKEQSLGYLMALQELKPKLMDGVLNDSLNKITIDYDREKRTIWKGYY